MQTECNIDVLHNAKIRKYVIASIIGNGLEWYDFAIFGYFAPVFSKQFFPSESVYASLVSTFAVFAAGFLSRPFGAYLFGKIGDQQGRKKALLISMLLMAISTSCMGLLPNYAQIGLAAPILLTMLRIFQGISIGGEFTGSLSFLLEHTKSQNKGFIGSWIYSGCFIGCAIGAIVGSSVTLFVSPEQLESWGWRIPFIFGLAIAYLGYIMRKRIEETPLFLALKTSHQIKKSPFTILWKYHLPDIARVVGILLPNSVWIYLTFVFIPAYMTQARGWSVSDSLLVNIVPMSLFVFALPMSGYLSDLWGKKIIMMTGFGLLTLTLPFAIQLLSDATFVSVLIYQIVTIVFLSLSYAPTAAFLAEVFPTSIRNTGMAISYHIAVGVIGGLTPLIITYLMARTPDFLGLMSYLCGVGILGMLTLILMKDIEEEVFHYVEA